ncbi:sporulation protein [Streptomyces sp. NPDC091371]|uniref:sporulation protein n=1 Tax=Streptomyces sp. NPDC091371 TaxID=3155303 RepID=UPI0034455725
MAFRKFLSALGVGAPEVETVLDQDRVSPGGRVTATVTVRGGDVDVEVDRLAVTLAVRFETQGEAEVRYMHSVARQVPVGFFILRAGEVRTEQAVFDIPLGMPLTHIGGRGLKGAHCAVVTELAIERAVDRSDEDLLEVHALPAQAAVFQAFEDLGFRHRQAEVKAGRASARQEVGWWQEIEMQAPADYRLGTVELMLVALESELDVCPGSQVAPLALKYEETEDQAALTARIDAYLRESFPRR